MYPYSEVFERTSRSLTLRINVRKIYIFFVSASCILNAHVVHMGVMAVDSGAFILCLQEGRLVEGGVASAVSAFAYRVVQIM